MEVAKLLFLLATAVAVSARIPNDYSIHRYLRMNYGDVLKSLYMIDFNITDKERESLLKYFKELTGFSDEEVQTVLKFNDIEDAALKSIANVKLSEDQEFELADHKYGMFMLAFNYDLIAQILDPNYEKNIFTIPIEKGYEQTEGQKAALDVISKRWTTDIAGRGVSVPENSLANFYDGTEEEIEERKLSVENIYNALDRFVMDTLGQSAAKYGFPRPPFYAPKNSERSQDKVVSAEGNKKENKE